MALPYNFRQNALAEKFTSSTEFIFPKLLIRKNSLHKEISSPHHKITIFNSKDKYLGLNLVVAAMTFVQKNFFQTHLSLNKSSFGQQPQRFWNRYMHMDIVFRIHPSHSICSQQFYQGRLLSMAILDQY